MMTVIEENIPRQEVIAAGQILTICKQLESSLSQGGAHIAGVSPGMILKCRDAEEMTCRRHVGAHASGAVRFTGNCDLGWLPADSLELGKVGAVLTLVIADLIVQGCIDSQLGDLQRNLLIRVPEHAGPWPVIPGAHLPFLPGLISGLPAAVRAILIRAGIADIVCARRVDIPGVLLFQDNRLILRYGISCCRFSVLVIVLLPVSCSLDLHYLALIRRTLKPGEHGIRCSTDRCGGYKSFQRRGVTSRQLFPKEFKLHLQISDTFSLAPGIFQECLLPAVIRPLGKPISVSIMDEGVITVQSGIESSGKICICHAELGISIVLQILRIQCALCIQVPHETGYAKGVVDLLHEEIPDRLFCGNGRLGDRRRITRGVCFLQSRLGRRTIDTVNS